MEEPRYLPYEDAKRLVSDIVEMEHPSDDGRRIFNVYNQRGEAICWFDADEVEDEIEPEDFGQVREHILHYIPEWAG
jgi:hypothetical protein